MPLISATSDYQHYLFIAEDVFASGGQFVIQNIDTFVYALADYPHWQVLTLSTVYSSNTYSLTYVSSSFNIRLTRPLILIDKKLANAHISGLFPEFERRRFYEHISPAYIQPEDGIEESNGKDVDPTTVKKNGNCNG